MKQLPPARRGSSVHRLVSLLADGPKTRQELLDAGMPRDTLRKAIQRLRERGWGDEALMLKEPGKDAAKTLAGWEYTEGGTRPELIAEQVREWKGVRW